MFFLLPIIREGAGGKEAIIKGKIEKEWLQNKDLLAKVNDKPS